MQNLLTFAWTFSGTSGVFTSMVRVLTRFLIKELKGSTIYFFTVSVSSVATCFAMYHLIRRTDFIQFYIALCERAKTKITLEPTEDAGLVSIYNNFRSNQATAHPFK